jgi:hypothetical protein
MPNRERCLEVQGGQFREAQGHNLNALVNPTGVNRSLFMFGVRDAQRLASN